MQLDRSFFMRRNVALIAKQLVGKVLATRINNQMTAGMIVETEAYSYKEKGSHAFRGMTRRNEVMFEEGGRAYVYLCYGVHEMFNVVTNQKGKADAVLIRSLQPLAGIEIMMHRTQAASARRLTSGPGKLTKALGVDRRFNGRQLNDNEIWIEDHNIKIKAADIVESPRIGIDYAGADALLPWRFMIKGNEWVSRI